VKGPSFSEEKEAQRLFIVLRGLGNRRTQMNKSFLVLFFKKEQIRTYARYRTRRQGLPGTLAPCQCPSQHDAPDVYHFIGADDSL
jgi:hypothetical protein